MLHGTGIFTYMSPYYQPPFQVTSAEVAIIFLEISVVCQCKNKNMIQLIAKFQLKEMYKNHLDKKKRIILKVQPPSCEKASQDINVIWGLPTSFKWQNQLKLKLISDVAVWCKIARFQALDWWTWPKQLWVTSSFWCMNSCVEVFFSNHLQINQNHWTARISWRQKN